MQLPLSIHLNDIATFDSFIAGQNALVVDVLMSMLSDDGEQQVFIWGEHGTGKTHLLQAACHFASKNSMSASYLPMSLLLTHGSDALCGLYDLDLVCIDSLNLLVNDSAWERELFVFINNARSNNCKILFASLDNISALNIKLKDLLSRLSWGPVFQLKALVDHEKLAVLQSRALARGLELPDEVGNFMLRHYKRDLVYLCGQLDCLDKASMAAQRRLTIPFVKSVMK